MSVGQSKIPIDHAPYPKFSSSQITCHIETVSKDDCSPKFEPITQIPCCRGSDISVNDYFQFFCSFVKETSRLQNFEKSPVLYFHIVIFKYFTKEWFCDMHAYPKEPKEPNTSLNIV